jgi:hypothetical protein
MKTSNPSKSQLWTGRIMSWLAILFFLVDGVMKFIQPQEVIDTTVSLGYQENQIIILGFLILIPTILYALPKTSILGAILITGYLGGAIATHLKLNNPLFSNNLFPVYFGILIWGGLWLANSKLRELFPLVKKFSYARKYI